MTRAIFLIIYNLIRISFMRIRHGKRCKIHWLQRISPGAHISLSGNGRMTIGRNAEFSQGCDFQVHGEGQLSIGGTTYFNRYCMISAHGKVDVGEHCLFGPGVKIFDNNHKFDSDGVSTNLSIGEIHIGDRCWIASDAIILKGAQIGDGCVIGAGCIIDHEVPAGSIVRLRQSQTVTTIETIS